MNNNLTKLSRNLYYQFKNIKLLEMALTHRSVTAKNNERLEFLGDSLVNMVIAEALYRKFPKASEGNLTRLRALLVCKETLADIAGQLEIDKFLLLGSGELKSGGSRRPSIKADALEAVIAAIYLDSDFAHCQKSVLTWFAASIDEIDLNSIVDKDPKTRLQEYLQARKLGLPEYKIVAVEGEQHAQLFHVCCKIKDIKYESGGTGHSRQRAEQEAALKALEDCCV